MTTMETNMFKILTMVKCVNRTFEILNTHPGLFLKITAAVLAPLVVCWVVGVVVWVVLVALMSHGSNEKKEASDSKPESSVVSVLFLVVYLLLSAMLARQVFKGTVIKAVADIYTGRQPQWATSLKFGLSKATTLMGAGILLTCATSAALLLFIVPGIYLSIRWYVCYPAIVIENKSATESMRRSYELTSNRSFEVFCMCQILFLNYIVLRVLWTIPFFLVTGDIDAKGILGNLYFAVPTVAFACLWTILEVVMYLNLRVVKEGLNLEVLENDMRGVTSGPSAGMVESDEEAPFIPTEPTGGGNGEATPNGQGDLIETSHPH